MLEFSIWQPRSSSLPIPQRQIVSDTAASAKETTFNLSDDDVQLLPFSSRFAQEALGADNLVLDQRQRRNSILNESQIETEQNLAARDGAHNNTHDGICQAKKGSYLKQVLQREREMSFETNLCNLFPLIFSRLPFQFSSRWQLYLASGPYFSCRAAA
jgi:hypothetical protein